MLSALRQRSACCSIIYSIRNATRVVGGGCVDGREITGRNMGRSLAATSQTGRGRGVAFELLDEDIEERFVKGSGPGGQKINKVRNCVQLTHIPSGVSVSCQDSRELHANRHIARKRLREKVEFHLKGVDSKVGRKIEKIRNRKARSQRRARLKHQGAASVSAAASAAAASATAAGGADAVGVLPEQQASQSRGGVQREIIQDGGDGDAFGDLTPSSGDENEAGTDSD